jgi:IS5 family transposase
VEEYETLESLLQNSDLGFVNKLLMGAFHQEGPGRTPRNPLGVFKAHLAKRYLGLRGIRELERRLWNDPRLRHICDIEDDEPAYGRSVLSRFPGKVGIERLQSIIDHLLKGLKGAKLVKGKNVAMDASFIKAYSSIDMKNRLGRSDPDARIGRGGKGYGLGYNLHLSVDADSELPIAFKVTPANIRDIEVAPELLKATRRELPRGIEHTMADRGYSSDGFRKEVRRRSMEPIIPYRSNQHRGERGLLRIDKYFKTHGPTRLKRLYKKRNAVERVFSRMKEQLSLGNHKVRGLVKITLHVQLCIIGMLLNAQAAINNQKRGKILSIAYYAN